MSIIERRNLSNIAINCIFDINFDFNAFELHSNFLRNHSFRMQIFITMASRMLPITIMYNGDFY